MYDEMIYDVELKPEMVMEGGGWRLAEVSGRGETTADLLSFRFTGLRFGKLISEARLMFRVVAGRLG